PPGVWAEAPRGAATPHEGDAAPRQGRGSSALAGGLYRAFGALVPARRVQLPCGDRLVDALDDCRWPHRGRTGGPDLSEPLSRAGCALDALCQDDHGQDWQEWAAASRVWGLARLRPGDTAGPAPADGGRGP